MITQLFKKIVHSIHRLLVRKERRYTLFSTSYPGFVCHVPDKSSFLYMYDEIFSKGIYDFPSHSPAPYIIDCGSNIGLSIIRFKQRFPEATVIGFEPDSTLHALAQKNVLSAKCDTGVTIHNAALDATAGTINFYRDGADGGSLTATDSTTPEIVPAVQLSTFIDKPVDFLKIDIEGAELVVLQQIEHTLHLVERLFIEYHSFLSEPQTLDTLLAILKKAGFRYYLEHVGIRSENVFAKVEHYHTMDLQINVYAYRPTSTIS
jgi:FkbM family methyltransferase